MIKTRNLVVEYATMLDEVCSICLCELLQINKETSLSFGYKTQALSFNNKINLLYDLAGTDKIIKNKFQLFAEIRNKFAHVFSISTFKSLSELDKDWKKNCDKLLNWYFPDLSDYPNDEFIYAIAYILLFKELENYTLDISNKNSAKRGYEAGRKDVLEQYYTIINQELLNHKDGLDILKVFIKEIEN